MGGGGWGFVFRKASFANAQYADSQKHGYISKHIHGRNARVSSIFDSYEYPGPSFFCALREKLHVV